VAGCSSGQAQANPPSPLRVDGIYFVFLSSTGDFVAYVPGHAIKVVLKIDSNVTEPYIEVPKFRISSLPPVGRSEEYVSWLSGGTLYIKDQEQLRNLLIRY
jgi:hypothetical protein